MGLSTLDGMRDLCLCIGPTVQSKGVAKRAQGHGPEHGRVNTAFKRLALPLSCWVKSVQRSILHGQWRPPDRCRQRIAGACVVFSLHDCIITSKHTATKLRNIEQFLFHLRPAHSSPPEYARPLQLLLVHCGCSRAYFN